MKNLGKKRSQSSAYIKFLPISKSSHQDKDDRPLTESIRSKSNNIESIEKKTIAVDKFKNHTFEKYNRLVYGSKLK